MTSNQPVRDRAYWAEKIRSISSRSEPKPTDEEAYEWQQCLLHFAAIVAIRDFPSAGLPKEQVDRIVSAANEAMRRQVAIEMRNN